MTTETRLNTSEANTKADKPETKATDTANSFTRGKALTTTALDVASEAILSWRPTHREGPHLLEAVLRFLDVAWIHAAEHVAAFDTIRTNVSFFRALADIVCETTQVPSTVAQDLDDADSALHSRSDDSVATYCYQKMCQARSLRLLQHDIQLGGILKNSSKNDKPSKASLDAMLDMLTSSDRILGALETCFSMPCDPQMRASLERKLVELFPSIYVDQLRHPARKDDFDLDRRYGDDYHFNTASFRAKAEGRILDHESAGEVALIEEGLLAIQTINMEWSLIDVQNSVLQAWTQCVELCMGRIVAQALGQSKMSGMEKTIITAWTRLATLAADEGREGDFMRGVHAMRMALLTKLMELAWDTAAAWNRAARTRSYKQLPSVAASSRIRTSRWKIVSRARCRPSFIGRCSRWCLCASRAFVRCLRRTPRWHVLTTRRSRATRLCTQPSSCSAAMPPKRFASRWNPPCECCKRLGTTSICRVSTTTWPSSSASSR